MVKAGKQNQNYEFKLPPQTETGTLNVRVGDLTKGVTVEVANRPELSSLSASITLPAYLQYKEPIKADVRGGAISVLKGSVAEFEAEVSRNLAEATVKNQPATVEKNRVKPSPLTVAESDVLDFRWRDELGLTSREAFSLKTKKAWTISASTVLPARSTVVRLRRVHPASSWVCSLATRLQPRRKSSWPSSN